MKKVKITVLKRTLQKDLASEYGVDNLALCSRHKEEQTFINGYEKPAGFCDEAWKAISHYVFALAHGAPANEWFYQNWIKTPGVAICSCNDGLRPVIFKLESTEEEATLPW